MSFESGRQLGLVASLIAVIVPVITGILYVSSLLALFNGYSSGFSAVNPIFGLTSLSAVSLLFIVVTVAGLAGIILFLVAMRRLSEYYSEPAIFKNALNGFLVNLVGIAVFVAIIIAIFAATLFHTAAAPTSVFPAIGFVLIGFFVIAIAAFALAIVSAVFYKRAFDSLAQKSGVYSFNTAGTLYLWGTVLTIILIGALLIWIAWIFALSGFYSLKPNAAQQSSMSPSPTTPVTGASRRFCQYCGEENAQDAVYCQVCGKQIQTSQ